MHLAYGIVNRQRMKTECLAQVCLDLSRRLCTAIHP